MSYPLEEEDKNLEFKPQRRPSGIHNSRKPPLNIQPAELKRKVFISRSPAHTEEQPQSNHDFFQLDSESKDDLFEQMKRHQGEISG